VRVPVIGLVGKPGETRPLTAAVAPSEFGDAPWGPADHAVQDPVQLDLQLEAVVEGILVRGEIGFEVELACARCLDPQLLERRAEVAELFIDPTRLEEGDDDPGYELLDDRTAIDLSTLVRDALLIDLPLRVLCREDCQGLCPACGADRNRVDCGHGDDDAPDPRWARLQDLELSDLELSDLERNDHPPA
jgi:uncharacterized protein